MMETRSTTTPALRRRGLFALVRSKTLVYVALLGAAWMTSGAAGAQQVKTADSMAERMAACVACHGAEGRSTSEGFFPRIAGKPAGYLYKQMIHFRDGRRQSPAMNHMVAHLSDDYLAEIAAYFSQLHPPYPAAPVPDVPAAVLEHGRSLAIDGDASRGIPACVACHGEKLAGVLPAIPGLLGLPRDYLVAQFGAWKLGIRNSDAPDCMATLSKQLTPEDIGAVAAWLSSQEVPEKLTPAPASSLVLPMPCGGLPQ